MTVVTYKRRGDAAIVTIDRPEARNAVNADVAQGIETAIDRAEDDDGVAVLVLTGAPPVFCAGADLRAIADGAGDGLATLRGGFAGITRRERRKPVVAAVEGAALAGGMEIVLSCDLVVASEEARFGIPEVKRGLVAGAGGMFRLARRLPLNLAMELAITGGTLDARRAHHHGFVNRLCPAGDALAEALTLAAEVSANGPLAVRETRRNVLAAVAGDDDAAWRLTDESMAIAFASQDVKEGVAAFLEKRAPVWSGR